jgi:hypothetical protein
VRVECESCRALVVASFAIDGAAVRVTCSVCRHVMNVPGGLSERVVERPVAVPSDAPLEALVDAVVEARDGAAALASCPKCEARYRGEARACPACGLATSRMAAYAEARDAAAVPASVPEVVQAAWARTALDWNDTARHDELLQLVATSNAYAWAAGRYRTRGRDAVAQRQLDRLRRAAEAALLASATPRPDASARTSSRVKRRVLALLITTITAGALYAMGIADSPAPSGARSIPARLVPLGHPARPPTGK